MSGSTINFHQNPPRLEGCLEMGPRDASRQVGLPGGGHETLEDAARQLHLKRFCCVTGKVRLGENGYPITSNLIRANGCG